MADAANTHDHRFKRLAAVILKTVLWLLAVPLFLLLSAFVAIQFKGTQRFITQKATGYLSSKLRAKVQLSEFTLHFPKAVVLKEVYVEDRERDTLLYGQLVEIDLNLWDLLSKKIVLNDVKLENLTGHISRAKGQEAFNFSFIAEAFAPKEKPAAVADSSKSDWQFSVERVSLKHIYFTYNDLQAGITTSIVLGSFDSDLDAFDLNEKKIHVDQLALKNTRFGFRREPSFLNSPDTAAVPFDYDITFNTLQMDTVTASYCDRVGGQQLNATIGHFEAKAKQVDLQHLLISLSSVTLNNSHIAFTQSAIPSSTTQAKQAQASEPLDWLVQVKQLELTNNDLSYDNNTATPETTGFDANHLKVEHSVVIAENIYLSPGKIAGELKRTIIAERDGFAIKAFSGKFVYDSTHIALSDLHLQTAHSRINDRLSLRYRSLQQLSDSLQNAEIDCSFDHTTISARDIFYFVPERLRATLKINRSTELQLSGKIRGTLNDLAVSRFEMRTGSATHFKISGQVKSLMRPENLYASASFEVESGKKDVEALLPDSLIPKGIELPASFSLIGSYTGYLKNFDADVALSSTIGHAKATVKMNPKAGNVLQPYNGTLSTTDLDLGKLIRKPETFGVVSLNASVKGSGTDTSNLHADVQLDIEKAVFKDYPYSNFRLDGTLDRKSFSGKAAMNDENLAFNFDGTIDLEPAHPRYTFTLDLNGADLKALHLSEEDLRVSLLAQSDIDAARGENISGKTSIKNMLVIRNNHRYPVDSLVLSSETTNGVTELHLSSEIMNAAFSGTMALNQLPEAFKQHINSYFNLQQSLTPTVALKKQDFKFEFNLVDPSLLVGNIVPKLQNLTPFSVKGSYNSEARDLELAMNVPQIRYDSITVDSLKLNLSSNAKKLDYHLRVAELSNPTFKFENMLLDGELKDNQLSFAFSTAKDDSAKLLAIGGILKSMNREFELKLNSDLVLNTQKWNISNSNYLRFSKQGVYANDLSISNTGQSLSLNSRDKRPGAPLEISFKNFDITTVSRLVENKKDLVNGTINGTVFFEKQNGAPAFRSDLVITGFAFKSVPVGTIRLKAENFENPSKYLVDLHIEGNGNDLEMKGAYTASQNSQVDLILDIHHLNLSSVEPFTFGQVTRMSGSMNGRISIKGDAKLPMLDGQIRMKEAAFRPSFINSYLTVNDAALNVERRKLRFNNFTLLDSLKHSAVVDGSVDINDMKKILLDLRIKTDDFLALNTAKKDNPLYYGTIIIDSDIKARGTLDAPVVDAKLKLNKGTSVTYVKPESQITKNESKGIVEFVNRHPEKNIAIMARQNDSIDGITSTRGIDMHASIDIDRSAQLKVIVDPVTGDSLFTRGGGLLDFTLDPSGRMSLSGKYRINDGGYYLSLENIVKRSFKIQRGSTVSWSGDVLDPYIELTAIYTIKTSPLDLVADELNGVDEMEKNKYRNLLTFNVYLKMTGFIASPQISFDIQLAPEDRGALNGAVNGQLGQLREDETRLNKQVFALLTLGRFVGENPLESSSDGGLSSASRASASKVLTQQLSSLSGKYVKFVDLDLGVNSFEDYSTGQEQGRTQLQVGVSKQLFKNRVTVRVGGNVDVEGERASQNDVNDVAGDVNIDYKLTDDGRYKLKGFRENQYENPIEGELIKTGAGIVYMRNFNTLKELLAKPVRAQKPKEPKEKPTGNDDDEKLP